MRSRVSCLVSRARLVTNQKSNTHKRHTVHLIPHAHVYLLSREQQDNKIRMRR